MSDPLSGAPLTSLGKYHIVRPLKVGGTAAIYLAVMRGEDNFSREVVIKRPLPHLVADPRSRKMFLDEAHIASRLNHPNICQVLDLVARENELYLVLEYLRGVDLREILKRCIHLGRLMPPEVAVWMAIETAAGLDFAHDATNLDGEPLGLVHRDVSPKNIRITHAGSVKVIDFGIAWATGRQTETAAGTIKGTLGYMSPEQILGDDIDRRSDVFAFGICLFQMLTLRNPFDGPTLKERVRRLTQAPIPSVAEFNPALDEEIAGIVARCLDRDITRRYPRLRDVQVDLDRYLARLQVVSPRQRLVEFLESIFPDLHELDAGLKSAMSELSRVTGRIDTAQRLVFPDDPPTEQERPAQGTLPDGTGVTGAADTAATAPESTRATLRASEPPHSEPHTEAGATRPVPAQSLAAAPVAPRRGGGAGVVAVALLALVLGGGAAWWVSQRGDVVEVASIEPAADAGAATANPPDASAPAAPDAGALAIAPPPPPPPPRRPPPPPRPKGVSDGQRSRLFFRTARRMGKQGQRDRAVLLYQLAYAYGGRRPNPAILLNLGLLYNADGDRARAKACLRGYLARQPDAPMAPRVRTLVSSFPATETVECVSRGEARAARTRYARQGAAIDAWVEQTVEGMLR